MREHTVAIVGGGFIGSAVAYFLTRDPAFRGQVLVFEPDPSYHRSSTARSAAAIRQQFNLAVNIQLSQHSYAFLAGADEELQVDGRRAAIGLTERGYLILAPPEGVGRLERAYELQRSLGVAVTYLTPEALQARFPWLSLEGVGAACLACARRAGSTRWRSPGPCAARLRRWGRATSPSA